MHDLHALPLSIALSIDVGKAEERVIGYKHTINGLQMHGEAVRAMPMYLQTIEGLDPHISEAAATDHHT